MKVKTTKLSAWNTSKKCKSLTVSGILVVSQLGILLSGIHKLGIDPIQDSLPLNSIYALRSGKNLYLDVIEYKGPLFPILANMILPGNALSPVNVKFLTLILAITSSFVAHLIIKRVNLALSVLIPLIWLITTPALSSLYSRPWPGVFIIEPSLLLVFLYNIFLYSIIRAQTSLKNSERHFRFALASLAIALTPWIRIQSVPIFLAWILYLMFLFFNGNNSLNSRRGIFFCLVSSLGVQLILLRYLESKGALRAWYEVTFLLPKRLRDSGSTMVNWIPGQFLKTFFVYSLMSSLLLITIYFFYLISLFFNHSVFINITTFIVTFSAAFFFIHFGRNRNVDPTLHLNLNNWSILIAQWLPLAYGYLIILSSILMVFLFLACYGTTFLHNRKLFNVGKFALLSKNNDYSTFFSVMILFNSILFLYPNFGNLWFVLGSATPALMYLVMRFNIRIFHDLQTTIVWVLAGILLALSSLLIDFQRIHFVKFKSNLLQGIFASGDAQKNVLDNQLQFIENKVKGLARFHCVNGLLSIASKQYLSETKDFSNQEWMNILPLDPLPKSSQIVLCEDSFSDREEILRNGFRVTAVHYTNNEIDIEVLVRDR